MPICSMAGLSFCASSAFPISGAETLSRNEERSAASSYLPEAFAQDPDRLARFQREAQVLASLNHPFAWRHRCTRREEEEEETWRLHA